MPSQTVVLSFLTFSLIKLLLPAVTSVLPSTGLAVVIVVADDCAGVVSFMMTA